MLEMMGELLQLRDRCPCITAEKCICRKPLTLLHGCDIQLLTIKDEPLNSADTGNSWDLTWLLKQNILYIKTRQHYLIS